ncbi:hypothetical protein, partial [Nostoc sp. UHCC 0251]|uniref:hypothetical protein n=1 Tax=Nostoc sp. UHCC 0251 TaxID=3110240 RepID=UPI002B21A346
LCLLCLPCLLTSQNRIAPIFKSVVYKTLLRTLEYSLPLRYQWWVQAPTDYNYELVIINYELV